MKNAILKSAVISAIAAIAFGAAGTASADNTKHYGRYYGSAPVHTNNGYYGRPHHGYGHGYGHGYSYGHGNRGYWREGRWIAPVAVAATIGALAIAANSNYYAPPTYYSAPTYYNPPVVYSAPTTYVSTTYYTDQFDAADRNRNGYVSYREAARVNGDWARNFSLIDANRDGYITRDEINWFYHR